MSAPASASRSTKTRLRPAASTELRLMRGCADMREWAARRKPFETGGATRLIMDQTNRNTALASAMVEELARSGVRRAVFSPGSLSTPLAVALRRHPEIDVTVIL